MAEEIVDVLIIGSGHSGGMAAKVLTEKGISCLMLNAGPVADAKKDTEVKAAYALPYRGFMQPGQLSHVLQANEFNANTWVDEKEIPYTYDPTKPYNWVRVRLFGGRSLFWSRQSFRLSDYEFKGKSHDGFGDDWPISLADVAPYYARVEAIFRVHGHADGLPQYPDGNFIQDNSPWTGSFQRFVDAGKQKGVPVCKARSSEGVDGLASSVNLLLPDAFSTGKLRAIPNVVVRQLTVDKNTGLINEAHFVDRISRREMSVKARVVVLAAGTLESTRLLLNSQLANSSGVMGHYLIDQIYGAGIQCSVPEARDGKSNSQLMGGSALVPRFRNIDSQGQRLPSRLRVELLQQQRRPGPAQLRRVWRCSAEQTRQLPRQRFLYRHHGRGAAAPREPCTHQQRRSRCLGYSRAPHRHQIHRQRIQNGSRRRRCQHRTCRSSRL